MNDSSPRQTAQRGEEIYSDRYKADFEERHPGKYVAINVISGNAFVAETPEESMLAAQRAEPDGTYHVLRIGSPGILRLRYIDHYGECVLGR